MLSASLNTATANYDTLHWESLEQGGDADILWLLCETRHNCVRLAQTFGFTTATPGFVRKMAPSDNAPSIHLRGKLAPGASMTADKIVVMYTSRDGDDPVQAAAACYGETTATSRPDAESAAFDALLTASKATWHDYWRTSDFIIEGDDKAQLALRYNIYQLRISASAHDSRYSVAAKNGLAGAQYPWESTLDGDEATPDAGHPPRK